VHNGGGLRNVISPSGVILAGGRSRRMAGQTKALAELNGKPLMQHVIDRLKAQVSSLAISVESENPAFARFGLPQVPDPRAGSLGPLGGLMAGLEALPPGGDYLMLAPCDAPFVPFDLAQRLMEQLELSGRAGCMVRYEEELQPTFSLWHRRVLPDVRSAVLEQGLAGFKQLIAGVRISILDWAPEAVSPFFNVNTPEDLARAKALLNSHMPGLNAGHGVPK